MTQAQQNELKEKFDKEMADMMAISSERELDKNDFNRLHWIVRNMDCIRNHRAEELTYDASRQEVMKIERE